MSRSPAVVPGNSTKQANQPIMKTQLKLMILAGALGASAAFAQTGGRSYTITADLPYVSDYVFRGVKLARQSVQPSVTFTSGSLSLGVWSNQPVIKRTDDEIDFFGSYDFALTKDWKLTLGGTAYWYPGLDTSAGGDRSTFEPRLALSGPLGPVSSTLTVYYDTTLKTTTLEGALGYSLPMHGSETDTVDFGVSYGRVTPDQGRDYCYWGATAKATFRPKGNWSAYLGLGYGSSDLSGQRNHVYGTVGVSYSFSRP